MTIVKIDMKNTNVNAENVLETLLHAGLISNEDYDKIVNEAKPKTEKVEKKDETADMMKFMKDSGLMSKEDYEDFIKARSKKVDLAKAHHIESVMMNALKAMYQTLGMDLALSSATPEKDMVFSDTHKERIEGLRAFIELFTKCVDDLDETVSD